MPVRVAVYASSVTEGLGADKFERIMDDAARFNRLAGVTSVILFDGDRFFQYLEGPADGIATVYVKIRQSRSHTDIVDVAQGIVSARHMPYWPVKIIAVDAGVVKKLAAARWGGFARSVNHVGAPQSGVDYLYDIVNQHISSVLAPDSPKTFQ